MRNGRLVRGGVHLVSGLGGNTPPEKPVTVFREKITQHLPVIITNRVWPFGLAIPQDGQEINYIKQRIPALCAHWPNERRGTTVLAS